MSDLINYSKLDFQELKNSLKEYLRTKPEFQSFEFEGSGFSYLLDLLCYNTSQNAFLINMTANESFLSTATLADSVASRAKMLGYLPKNKTCSNLILNVEYAYSGNLPASIHIDRDTIVTADVDGKTYRFILDDGIYIYPNENDEFVSNDITLYEGTRLTHRFTVNNNDLNQRFILPNSGVDISKIIVNVQESEYNLGVTPYTKSYDITVQDQTSKVYYLQESGDNKLEVMFGDDVISFKPKTGNVVVVEYVVTNGSEANGVNVVELSNGFGTPIYNIGESGSITPYLTIVQRSTGGTDEETIQSIKKNAPLNVEVQNRGVTKSDFEYLIKQNYQFVHSVKVWGGQDNNPPRYGDVMIAIKPTDGFILDTTQKQLLKTNILRNISTLCQIPVIVDPIYTHIDLSIFVRYDAKLTRRTKQEIQLDITDVVNTYVADNVSQFDGSFISSQLQQLISNSNSAIVSNLLNIKMKNRIYPSLTSAKQYTMSFNNAIEKYDPTDFYGKAFKSDDFIYNNQTCFIAEESNTSFNLCIFQKTTTSQKLIKVKVIGSIDYINGYIDIQNFMPQRFLTSNRNYLDFLAKPQRSDIYPNREQIFLVDSNDIHIRMEVSR